MISMGFNSEIINSELIEKRLSTALTSNKKDQSPNRESESRNKNLYNSVLSSLDPNKNYLNEVLKIA